MENMTNEKYVAVDLHVHTPASDCYKKNPGKSVEENYLDIIRMYVEKGVKVIAITDHNTINGYNELLSIKANIENRIRYWSDPAICDGLEDKIQEQKERLQLFSQITILPGIEFEANPGIHLLFIFNPSEPDVVSTIEEFLEDNGYPTERRGQEKVQITHTSAIEAVKRAYELGAITIAAHIDSTKGAWEVYKAANSGSACAQLFSSSALCGVQVVKLETIDYLKGVFKNKEYKRERELSFMRFSDFHNKESIDGKVTYFNIERMDFDSLKMVICERSEYIGFTPNIEDIDVISKIVSASDTYSFENFKDDVRGEIEKGMCAILNKGKGCIVVGVGKNNTISGVKKTIADAKAEVSSIISRFSDFAAYYKSKEEYYELGDSVVCVLFIWSIAHVIYTLDKKTFIFDKKNQVIEANVSDIYEMGENNYKRSFCRINEINQLRIDSINREMELIKRTEDNVELHRKIMQKSVVSMNVLEINRVVPIEANYEISPFGISEGKIYYSGNFDAHYDDAYNRITCRCFADSGIVAEEQYPYGDWIGDCGIIGRLFAVHYINKQKDSIIDGNMALIFRFQEFIRAHYSLPAVLVWLKSPILLYHLYTVNGTYHLVAPSDFNEIPILLVEQVKKGGDIDTIAQEMILKEKLFLESISDINIDEIDEEIFIKHNYEILKLAMSAEKIFCSILNITEDEYSAILDFTQQEGWSCFADYYIDEDESQD